MGTASHSPLWMQMSTKAETRPIFIAKIKTELKNENWCDIFLLSEVSDRFPPPSGYSRSDCSGVRTRTVTLIESDWPMVSVTVSWNLYTPDVRFDTMIWSLKFVFCKTGNKTHS